METSYAKIGSRYYTGSRGVAIDFGTAFGMLTKVVELGEIVARHQLGSMYVNWRGSVATLLANTRVHGRCWQRNAEEPMSCATRTTSVTHLLCLRCRVRPRMASARCEANIVY